LTATFAAGTAADFLGPVVLPALRRVRRCLAVIFETSLNVSMTPVPLSAEASVYG
jgi:hypothetical protein